MTIFTKGMTIGKDTTDSAWHLINCSFYIKGTIREQNNFEQQIIVKIMSEYSFKTYNIIINTIQEIKPCVILKYIHNATVKAF
jgi:hypothetical protein